MTDSVNHDTECCEGIRKVDWRCATAMTTDSVCSVGGWCMIHFASTDIWAEHGTAFDISVILNTSVVFVFLVSECSLRSLAGIAASFIFFFVCSSKPPP